MTALPDLKPCPFCGADAQAEWFVADDFGKSLRVQCSRDGECPSPSWYEASSDHETDAECVVSVARFWNTRAEHWDFLEMQKLRLTLAQTVSELRTVRFERDRAMKACEQMGAQIDALTAP